jgi:hypothetical protein
MKAYAIDQEGYLQGELTCQASPLEPGVFLVPAGAVTIAPPEADKDSEVRFESGAWVKVESRAKTFQRAKGEREAKEQAKTLEDAPKRALELAKAQRREEAKQFAKAYRGKTFKNLAEASNAFEHLLVALGLD